MSLTKRGFNKMTSTYNKQRTSSTHLTRNVNLENIHTTRPVPVDGIVNIDTISDKEYDIVKEVIDASFEGRMKWKPLSLVSIVSTFLLENKMPDLQYKAVYNGYKISLSSNIRGKTRIKISTRFSNKTILETFCPFKPENQYGEKIGTSRSHLLYTLFKTVRYQIDGYLLAS
jgi:hypothetical protein